MSSIRKLPGNRGMSRRPLHFFWLLDCSTSMGEGGKIEALNNAIREAIPAIKDVAEKQGNAQIFMRVLKFSSGAVWHVANPVPLDDFTWTDLEVDGETDMGQAMVMLGQQLHLLSGRGLPPILLLISDGQPTDDFSAGYKDLMKEPWAIKAVRLSIAVGADANQEVLQKFIGDPKVTELRPLSAKNATNLARHIRWASTVAVRASAMPPSQASEVTRTTALSPPVIIPEPDPDIPEMAEVGEVW